MIYKSLLLVILLVIGQHVIAQSSIVGKWVTKENSNINGESFSFFKNNQFEYIRNDILGSHKFEGKYIFENGFLTLDFKEKKPTIQKIKEDSISKDKLIFEVSLGDNLMPGVTITYDDNKSGTTSDINGEATLVKKDFLEFDSLLVKCWGLKTISILTSSIINYSIIKIEMVPYTEMNNVKVTKLNKKFLSMRRGRKAGKRFFKLK